MQKVTFNCGQCGGQMAVGAEHLGTQVTCPLCQAVITAPVSPPGPDDRESIFSSAESSDDLFGAPKPAPVIEPPPPARIEQPGWQSTVSEPTAQPTVTVPARRRSSKLVPIVLILLVPYSIVSTAFIAWLLYNQKRNQTESLERMFDPAPKDGGPRLRVKHDSDLPAKLRTSLAKAIRIGDIEVTPLKVLLNDSDDLTLSAKMKNVSENTIFNPFPDAFLKNTGSGMNAVRPYTFLESGTEKIYGGFVTWQREPQGKAFDGVLQPQEEMVVTLSTMSQQRPQVRRLMQRSGGHVWRLHVRRGFVEVRGEPRSATAVIGVEFSTSAVSKAKQTD